MSGEFVGTGEPFVAPRKCAWVGFLAGVGTNVAGLMLKAVECLVANRAFVRSIVLFLLDIGHGGGSGGSRWGIEEGWRWQKVGDVSEMENDVTRKTKISGWKQKEPEVSSRKNPPVEITYGYQVLHAEDQHVHEHDCSFGENIFRSRLHKTDSGPRPAPTIPPTMYTLMCEWSVGVFLGELKTCGCSIIGPLTYEKLLVVFCRSFLMLTVSNL